MAAVTYVKYTLFMVNILSIAQITLLTSNGLISTDKPTNSNDSSIELTSLLNTYTIMTGVDYSSLTHENTIQYTFSSLNTRSILLSNSDTSSDIKITTVTNFLSEENSVEFETINITLIEASDTAAIEPTRTVNGETNYITSIHPSYTVDYQTANITRIEVSDTTAFEPTRTVNSETSYIPTFGPSHTVDYQTANITRIEVSDTTAIEPTRTFNNETSYVTSIHPSYTVDYQTTYITRIEESSTTAIEPTRTFNNETSYTTGIEGSYITGIKASTTSIERSMISNTSIMAVTSFHYWSESFVNSLYQFKSYSTVVLESSQLNESGVFETDLYGTMSIASSVSFPVMYTKSIQSSTNILIPNPSSATIFNSTEFSISSIFQEKSTTTPYPPSVLCIFECRVNVIFVAYTTVPQIQKKINETLSNGLKVYSDFQFLTFPKITVVDNTTNAYWFNLYFSKAYCDDDLKQAIIANFKNNLNNETANFTIQFNTLQIKPFSISDSSALNISLEIKLDTQYNKELKNESSDVYKTLKYLMIEALSSSLQNMTGFVEVKISGFEEGSIIVKSQLVFNKEVISLAEDIKPIIQVYIIRYFVLNNEKIGEYKVNITSLKLIEQKVPASSSSSFPAWLIVLIIALIIIVPLVLVIILLSWKINKKKGFQIPSIEDRSTKRSTIELQNLQLTDDVIENVHKNNNKESSGEKINHLFYGEISEEVNDENFETQEFDIPYQNK